MAKIKMGDRVRFLNAQGGGIVRKVQGKIAWVEGEDGFELPTPLHECVVVTENDSFIPAYRTPRQLAQDAAEKRERRGGSSASDMQTPLSTLSPPAPKPFYLERPEGEQLSFYLAWLPEDYRRFGSSPLECYLINDTNYHCFYTFAYEEVPGRYRTLSCGIIERDSKIQVDTVALDELNHREKLYLGLLPYKEEKAYSPKKALSLEFKGLGVKYFKRHCYTDNDFFEEDALILPLIERDKATLPQPENIDLTLLERTCTKEKEPKKATSPSQKQAPNKHKKEPLVVDLHANELLETLQGMNNFDILSHQLDVFYQTMTQHQGEKGMEIVFIHGKGAGVLRKALLDALHKKYPKATAQDASFLEYGFGATKVTIH